MNIKQLRGYIFGVVLLVAVLAGAATLPLLFRREIGPGGDTTRIDESHRDYAKMSRDDRISLVGFHMAYAATESDLPYWMEVRRILPAEVEYERREALADKYEEIMNVFHLDRRSRREAANAGKLDISDITDGINGGFAYLESEKIFQIVDRGDNYYIFTNADGEAMRVWHIYGRLTLEWTTWVNMYMDIDTGEIYFFYISSNYLGNTRMYDGGGLIELDHSGILNLWSGLIGRSLLEMEPAANYARVAVFLSGDDDIRYNTQWSADRSLSAYDLKLTMMRK